jgi:centromere protein C
MPPPSFIPHRKPQRQQTDENESVINDDDDDDDDDDDNYHPKKRTKKGSSAPALMERDPNSRTQSYSPSKSLWSHASRKPGSRTLQILRESTPLEDNPIITRSGRRSVRPLEYWAGEKIDRDPEGTIVNVVRAESVEVEGPSRKRGQRKKPRKDLEMEIIQEEEDDIEEWEAEGEVQQGPILVWDPEAGAVDGEEDRRKSWNLNVLAVSSCLILT